MVAHPSSVVTWCKVKYNNFQLENSSIFSGILYKQFLIDRDSFSNIVGYFYDVALRRIYKNRQEKLAKLAADLFARIEAS